MKLKPHLYKHLYEKNSQGKNMYLEGDLKPLIENTPTGLTKIHPVKITY